MSARRDHPTRSHDSVDPVRRLALVPAAGRSRRMGRPKLLLPFGDSTVLGSLLDALEQGGAEGVVLVLAPAELSKADAALHELARQRGLEVALNPRPERGMLSSLQAGVAALPPVFLEAPDSTLLITPADLPALTAETVRQVIEAREHTGAELVVPVLETSEADSEGSEGPQGRARQRARRRGHPLALSPARVREIQELDPAIGLRQLLQRHADEVVEVPVRDTGAFRDVDRPGDWSDLHARR